MQKTEVKYNHSKAIRQFSRRYDMKVKTLLALLKVTTYRIVNEDGWTLEEDYISDKYDKGYSFYEDSKVVKVKTNLDSQGNDILVITVK